MIFWFCFRALLLTGVIAILSESALAQVSAVEVTVDGMSCPFCAFGVEKKLKSVEGVRSVAIDMQAGTATVHAGKGGSIDASRVPKAIRDAGFTPRKVRLTVTGRVRTEEEERLSLAADGLHRPIKLVGGEESVRERLLALTGSENRVEIVGSLRNPEGEVWELVPEQVQVKEVAE